MRNSSYPTIIPYVSEGFDTLSTSKRPFGMEYRGFIAQAGPSVTGSETCANSKSSRIHRSTHLSSPYLNPTSAATGQLEAA